MVTRTVLIVLLLLGLANLAALLGVFLRRLLKNRFFALKDERRLIWGQAINTVLSGEPAPTQTPSLRRRWDREAAEEVLLERLAAATPEQRKQLQGLFRRWGLFEDRIRRLLWGNPWQQARSALVLVQMQCEEALPAVVTLLDDPHPDVRLAGVNALSILGRPDGVEPLIALLRRGGEHEARPILEALIRCGRNAPERLLPHLEQEPQQVRVAVAAALAEVARKEELPGLLRAVADPEPEVRAKVARALGRTQNPKALDGLGRLAEDPVWYVRLQAMAGLGRLGHPNAEPLVWRGIQDPDRRVRSAAAVALHDLLGDPGDLLARLRAQGVERAALVALVDKLSHEGVLWEAVNRVHSPLPTAREESRKLVCRLLEAGFYTEILYTVETHVDLSLRQELLGLVEKCAGREVRTSLAALRQSPVLDADSRRRVDEMLARWEARA